MELEKIKQEPKGPKRIAIVSWLNAAILKKLTDWEKYFDHDLYSPEQRRKFFESVEGLVQKQAVFDNITPTVGFAQIAKGLTGNLASLDDLIVKYHVLGTDDGTILPIGLSNVALGDEQNRKLVTSKSQTANKAAYTIVYAEAEANGTWDEMGLVIGGTITPDSGILWDRTLYPFVKTASQAVTFDYEDTLVNV